MAKKVEIVLNSGGIQSLLKSEGVKSMLEDKASEIKGRLPSGYDSDSYTGKNRANVSIYAESQEAR